MTCKDCEWGRDNTDYQTYTPACLWCGARYWKAVGAHRRAAAHLGKWRQHIEDTWKAMGHDPEELRQLAMAKTIPFEPVTKGKR